jgi:hypothetical protein
MSIRNPLENSPIWSTEHNWEENVRTDFEGIIMARMNLIHQAQNSIQ